MIIRMITYLHLITSLLCDNRSICNVLYAFEIVTNVLDVWRYSVTDLMNCHGFAYMNCHQIDLFSVISQPHRAAA